MRAFLREALEPLGRPIAVAKDGAEAVEQARQRPIAVAVVDIKMPRLDGLSAIATMRGYQANIVCLVMTAFPAEQMTVNLLRADIYNCLTKPVDLSVLRRSVSDALALSESPRHTSPELSSLSPVLLGVSESSAVLREAVVRAAEVSSAILLLGETGSCWGSIAKAIHELSVRRDGPFVTHVVDLESSAEQAAEEAAAAWGDHFALAAGGTLFLNHLGRLPLAAQWRLVRQMEHVDASRSARVIVAREERAEAAPMLPELLQRFSRSITVPPLRQRREDIPQLAEEAIQRCNRIFNRQVQQITVTALEQLMNYAWPRNIDELEECIQQGVLLSPRNTLVAEAFPESLRASRGELALSLSGLPTSLRLAEAVEQATAQIERQMILKALEANRWNRTQAAQQLGISRKSLHNKLKKYGIQASDDHQEDEPSDG